MAIFEHTTDSPKQKLNAESYGRSELNAGRDDGVRIALWEIRDRAEFLRLLAAMERSRAAFLIELRSTQFVADGGVAAMPLDEFEDLMFGSGAGGVYGTYAQGFMSSFALVAPFVASLH